VATSPASFPPVPDPHDDLESQIDPLLAAREAAGLLRRRRTLRVLDSVRVERDGRELINFAGNDYLGLTHHPRLIESGMRAACQAGVGAGAAGLITGYAELHALAERELATLKQTESAILLPSGYQANLAAIQAVATVAAEAGRPVRFLLDKLAHASLVDAVRASSAAMRVFPHNHMEKLARLLRDADPGETQVVVTESIFSMDGDAADLETLASLKRSHRFLLILDEAHATGVYGDGGAGLLSERKLSGLADLNVVTLSKAIGCQGGAVCGSKRWCDAVVNYGRSYIFSTSVSPLVAACVAEAVQVMREEPQRRQRVRELAKRVRSRLASRWNIPEGDSPIIPLVVGEERKAIDASQALLEAGLLVPAVRPPTVPRGGSRLRVTLSCDHSDEQVDRLIAAVSAL
jgi:8-amino-7-oxononanoate synthase